MCNSPSPRFREYFDLILCWLPRFLGKNQRRLKQRSHWQQDSCQEEQGEQEQGQGVRQEWKEELKEQEEQGWGHEMLTRSISCPLRRVQRCQGCGGCGERGVSVGERGVSVGERGVSVVSSTSRDSMNSRQTVFSHICEELI